jgi:hypothetical protein
MEKDRRGKSIILTSHDKYSFKTEISFKSICSLLVVVVVVLPCRLLLIQYKFKNEK